MANYKTYTAGKYADSDELKKAKQDSSYWSKQQLEDFQYGDFFKSNQTNQYQQQLDSLKAPGDFSFSKQQGWDDIYNKIMNREKFTYDVNGDALYQQYKDQYVTQGKIAMMDTMGQAAAMTGGYGNSYAQNVGQQAYQGYLQQLNDKVPELYQLALSKYNSEGEELYNQYALHSDQYDREYGQHRDAVSDYQTNRNYLANRVDASLAADLDMYNTNRDTALAKNESRNKNVTDNRSYYAGLVSDLANREWDQYTDRESIAAKAIEMYNDNIYKNEQTRIADAELAEKKRQFDKEYEASTGYTSDGQKSTTFRTEAEKEFNPYQYAYTNADGQTVFNYDGKEVKVETGLNPYTRTRNPDAKNGTFSNGYQPNNVNGKKLSKTGQTDVVNGVTQNVWKTPDGTKYIWDGTKNAYLRYED